MTIPQAITGIGRSLFRPTWVRIVDMISQWVVDSYEACMNALMAHVKAQEEVNNDLREAAKANAEAICAHGQFDSDVLDFMKEQGKFNNHATDFTGDVLAHMASVGNFMDSQIKVNAETRKFMEAAVAFMHETNKRLAALEEANGLAVREVDVPERPKLKIVYDVDAKASEDD